MLAKIRSPNFKKLFIGEINSFELHFSIQNGCNHSNEQVFIQKMFKIVEK